MATTNAPLVSKRTEPPMIRNHRKLIALVQCYLHIMTTMKAPSVSKRLSEPNDSKSSRIDGANAVLPSSMNRNHRKLIVLVPCSLYIMTAANVPSVSKRSSEPNDSKSLQIDRFSAMSIKYDDNNKCADRFYASFRTQ